jgi:hypothetical protein
LNSILEELKLMDVAILKIDHPLGGLARGSVDEKGIPGPAVVGIIWEDLGGAKIIIIMPANRLTPTAQARN